MKIRRRARILSAFRRHNNQPLYQWDERGASGGRYPAIGASILAAAVGGPPFRGSFFEQNSQSDSQVAGRAVSSHVMCCRTRHRQLTPVAYPGVSMIGLYDSIVKIVISHHVQFSYLGLVFISSRDQAFFPQFFAALGPR
jgi:hypothetical protein